MDLARAGIVARAAALERCLPLYEDEAGLFARQQMAALATRAETGWIRELRSTCCRDDAARARPGTVTAKLALMREALDGLESVGDPSGDQLGDDVILRAAIERFLILLVDQAVAINLHLAASTGHDVAATTTRASASPPSWAPSPTRSRTSSPPRRVCATCWSTSTSVRISTASRVRRGAARGRRLRPVHPRGRALRPVPRLISRIYGDAGERLITEGPERAIMSGC